MATWFKPYRSALAARDLRLLFTGLIVSATGSWAYNVGLLALVYERTHSLVWIGAAGIARFVPALIASPYGGVIAERTERIRLMVIADVLCRIVRMPTSIWRNGPTVPFSVTSTGRLRVRIRATINADTAKLAEFTAKVHDGDPSTIRTAPTAGPAITTRLSIVPLMALAATRSFSVTIDGMVAATAGL